MDLEARDFGAAEAGQTPNFPPIVVNRAAGPQRARIRVVLLNIAGDSRLSVVEECLKRPPLRDPDVVLLCEANTGTRRLRGFDVASELAAALDMSYAFVPEFGFKIGDDDTIVERMGNAILCRQPLDEVVAVAMPSAPKSRLMPRRRRNVTRVGVPTGLYASARFGGETIALGVAHLDSRCGPVRREQQLAAYMAEFPRSGRAIFGGDLNTTTTQLRRLSNLAAVGAQMIANPRRFRAPESREPLFERIKEAGLETEGVNVKYRATFTFSGVIPHFMRPKLDWLAVRGMRAVAGSAAVIAPKTSIFSRRASDHDFVTVELEL